MSLPSRTLFEPMPPDEVDEFSRVWAAFIAEVGDGPLPWRNYVATYDPNWKGNNADDQKPNRDLR